MLSTKTCLGLFLLAAFCAPVASGRQSAGGAQTREQASLVEEQSLLARKLARIIGSMLRLAEQYESEGRTHGAKLLRDGLAHIAARETEGEHMTLEERMTVTQERLGAGQSMQSIESQEAIVAELEALYAIMMDRPDLDQLETELEKLREQKRQLTELANAEKALREKTEELREDSSNEAQKNLEERIAEARERQRELLRQNEEHSREVGAIDLERLEQELESLRRDQHMDAQVLQDWEPGQTPQLEQLVKGLDKLALDRSRAQRLEEAASSLRVPSDPAQATERARELDEAAQAAERAARASGDEAAEQVARSMQAAARSAREAGESPEQQAQLQDALEAVARELDAQAAKQTEAAEKERAAAAEALGELAESSKGSTQQMAQELKSALESEQGTRGSKQQAEETTAEALRQALEQSKYLGQALEASQERNAQRAEELKEAVDRLPQDLGEDGRAAQQALQSAAESMQAAAQQAAQKRSQTSSESAQDAERSLEEAQQALAKGRESQAQDPSNEQSQRNSELAAAQEQLAQDVQEMRELTPEASLDEGAQQAVDEALQEATEAMQQAAQEMQEGRNSSAARSQRKASEALAKAGSESSSGVQPQTPEQKERAEELAQEQERIEKELYEFRKLHDEEKAEDDPQLESLEQAQQSAQAAKQSLEEGELDDAQKKQKQAEKEIREALDELEEKEEQYQKLRNEELLFQIAEELKAMLEPHQKAMDDTREVQRGRQDGARVSRGQKLRLRKIARSEAALGTRAAELTEAIKDEGSLVFAELLSRIQKDLETIANRMGDGGGYQSGPRVQALQEDVTRDIGWLVAALAEEEDRREEEEQEGGGGDGPSPEGENRLVPDVAELKLLSQMDLDLTDQVEELLVLYPELRQVADHDPLLLEEIQRLAHRAERTTSLFTKFRERLGIEAPPDADTPKATDDEKETEE